VTHHLEEKIIAFVGDGSRWNVQVTFAHQNELRGNGDALLSVPREWIRDEPLMVVATDYILEENALLDLVVAHEQYGADITMSLKECSRDEMMLRSTVQIDSHWHVTRMIEKPKPEEILSPYAASILFILPPAIWDYLPKVGPSARGEIEMQSAIDAMIQNGMQAYGLHQSTPLEWTTEFINKTETL
jgi:dTDP-glucose pyrophosphorylase